jgi:hypothetical protein
MGDSSQGETPMVRKFIQRDFSRRDLMYGSLAARHIRLTMDEILKENKRLEVDLTGLKA